MSFYVDTHPVPDKLYAKYPAFVHLGVMSSSEVLHLPLCISGSCLVLLLPHCFSGDDQIILHGHAPCP